MDTSFRMELSHLLLGRGMPMAAKTPRGTRAGRVAVMGRLAMSITGLQLAPFIPHSADKGVLHRFCLTCSFSQVQFMRGGNPCCPCPVHTSPPSCLLHSWVLGLVTPAASRACGQCRSVVWGSSGRRGAAEPKCPAGGLQ